MIFRKKKRSEIKAIKSKEKYSAKNLLQDENVRKLIESTNTEVTLIDQLGTGKITATEFNNRIIPVEQARMDAAHALAGIKKERK